MINYAFNVAASLVYLGFRQLDDFSVLDNGDGTFSVSGWYSTLPQPTPEEIGAARHPASVSIVTEQIKSERDKRKAAGTPVGPYIFHSDPDSRIQQLGLVMMGAGMPAGIQWKTKGTGYVEMTPTLAQQIFGATAARDVALFAVADAHIAAAAASADPLAYDYSQGWPA